MSADPEELHDLAAARPQLAAALDAMLRAELASGENALSATGDYRAIDVYVKQQQQGLYQKFFLDNATTLARQYNRLLECEAARESQRVVDFVRAAPCLSQHTGVYMCMSYACTWACTCACT